MAIKSHQSPAQKTTTDQATWPDFAVGIFDKLTGRRAEITYEFDDLNVFIPSKLGEDADHFHWMLSGKLNIRTNDEVNSEQNGN